MRTLGTNSLTAKLNFAFGVDDDNTTLRVYKAFNKARTDITSAVQANMIVSPGLVRGTMSFQGKTVPYISPDSTHYVEFPSGFQPYHNNGVAPQDNGLTWVVIGQMPNPSLTAGYAFGGAPDPSDGTAYRYAKLKFTGIGASFGTPPWGFYTGGGSDRSCKTNTAFTGGEKVTLALSVAQSVGNNNAFVGFDGATPTAFDKVQASDAGSEYGYMKYIGHDDEQSSWYGPMVMLLCFKGQLTLAECLQIHADPFAALFSSGASAVVAHSMTYDPPTKKWADNGAVVPVTINGCQAYLNTQLGNAGPVYAKQSSGLVLVAPAGAGGVVTTPGYTAVVLENYQQHNDMAGGANKGVCIGYDSVGGRLVGIRYSPSAAPVAYTIASVSTVATGTPVAIAFDARRRRIVMFFPTQILYVNLYTGAVVNLGSLPSGVASFDRAIWDPLNDVILAYGDPNNPSKFHQFSFSDNDTSDQNYEQGRLWDGAGGTNFTWFNCYAGVPWVNTNGDYTNSQGVAQNSSSPYAALTFAVNNVTETKTADITQLVKDWIAIGNTGAILHAPGGAGVDLVTRFGANPPTLSVTTASGTYVCPPIATGDTGGSGPFPGPTSAPNSGTALMHVGSPQKAYVQFDISSIVGTPLTSVFSLTKTRQTDQSGPVQVYRCNPPKFYTDRYVPDNSGIAAKYPFDSGVATWTGTKAGLAADPDVLFCDPMTPGWSTRSNQYSGANPPSDGNMVGSGTDSFLGGGGYGRWAFEYGQGNALFTGSVINFYRLNVPDPDDVYCRFEMYFEMDFASCVTLVKMPGFTSQYTQGPSGKQPNVPYPGSLGGEGNGNTGSWCRVGNRATDPTHFSLINGQNVDYFSGPTLRMHLGAGNVPEPTDLNPYRKILSLFTGASTAADPNTDQDPWYFNPIPQLKRGRWYSIEQRLKVNTINMSAPDSFGNGTPNADGIYEVWVDGQKVYQKTNVIWSAHPSFKVSGFWLTMQHGGLEQTQANHTFRFANFVLAKKYIGPIYRTTLPTWLASAAPFQWVDIPNSRLTTNLSNAYLSNMGITPAATVSWAPNKYGKTPNSYPNYPYAQHHYSFSGMGHDEVNGRILLGGGDAHWADNSYHAFNYRSNTPSWTPYVVRGSNVADFKFVPLPSPYAPGDDQRLDRMYDGRHRGGHTYWSQQYIATGPYANCVLHFEQHQYFDSDAGYSTAVHIANLNVGDWDTSNPSPIPDVPVAAPDLNPWKWKHPLTQDVYQLQGDFLYVWKAATNEWQRVFSFQAPIQNWGTDSITGGINHEQNYILFAGVSGSGGSVPVKFIIDLNNVSAGNLATKIDITFTGPDAGQFAVGTHAQNTFVWCTDLQAFLFYKDTGVVYKVTRTGATTFDWTTLATTGLAPTSGQIATTKAGGVLNNFVYDPEYHMMILRIDDTLNMKAFRTL